MQNKANSQTLYLTTLNLNHRKVCMNHVKCCFACKHCPGLQFAVVLVFPILASHRGGRIVISRSMTATKHSQDKH